MQHLIPPLPPHVEKTVSKKILVFLVGHIDMVRKKNASHLLSAAEEESLKNNKGALLALMKLSDYLQAGRVGILQIFREFDTSKDGLLQENELMQGLMKLECELTVGQCKALITFLDKDGEGEIDLSELDNCMKKYRQMKKQVRCVARCATKVVLVFGGGVLGCAVCSCLKQLLQRNT